MNQRNNIVYVIPRPEIGGAEMQLLRLISHLDRTLYRATVICLDGPGSLLAEYQAAADDVIVLNRRGLFDALTFSRLLGHIRRIQPATVHTTLYIANLFGGWAARLAGVPNVVVSQRGLGIDPQHSRLKRMTHATLNTFIGMFADVRTVNSNAISDRMATYGWTDCRVIHNGILDRAYPDEKTLTTLKRDLRIPVEAKVLTSVARIDPKKDLSTMLRAFHDVRKSEPSTYLLIAGGGFSDYESRLRKEATELGIDDHVQFLGFRDDVTELLALCDVSLLSSITEGLPNAVLESMLLGKPVVATNVGGVPELIEHGVEGYLTECRDAKSFAGHVIELLRNPVRRESMGIFGRSRALSDFSVAATVEKTLNAYGLPAERTAASDTDDQLKANEPAEWTDTTTREWARSA